MVGWIVVGFMVVALLDVGYIAGKLAGLAFAGTVLALVGLLTARSAIPSARKKAGAGPDKHRPDPAASRGDFPVFLEISSDVTWATVSQRHFDHGIRPRLARLLDARLAERHGVTAAGQPERARELAGEDLWPLIDPARPLSEDSNTPGVSLAQLARIVARLEEL
jgi:hypothetical protein